MRVVDVMMGTPYHCRPDTNLGTATELMWTGNCGFLPVVGEEGRVVGMTLIAIFVWLLGRGAGPPGT